MIVANPIYDIVFKYLMEDERIAKTLLSALLKKEVVDVKVRRNEYTNTTRESLSIFRIDFGATIREPDGSKHLVLIELQKTWLETETLRFRQYLSVHYQNPKNIVEDSRDRHAIPMVAVYLLGHRVGDIDEPVLYVRHQSYDYDGHLVTKGLPNPFVDSLTHDSIIVQIPLLRGCLNSQTDTHQNGKSRLDKVLSIFDQSNKEGQNRKVLNIDDSLYNGDDDMQHILQRLAMAAGDTKLRQDMNIEEEFISAIERRDTEILHRDYELAKQKVLINEQKTQLDEQKTQLDEQKTQLAQRDASLRKSIQMLRAANLSDEVIALSLDMDVNEIKRLME